MLSKSRILLFFRTLTLLSSAIGSSALATVNVTVDDQNGDERTGAMPTYSPPGIWNQGADCTHCSARPDPSLAFDNTWHDTTAEPGDDFPTVEISFTGTAVYAFFILGNDIPGAQSLTNLTFTLDGNEAGTFVHIPTSSTDYEFNVPGFAQTGLENNLHTLIISDIGTPSTSIILFDYLIYTAEEDEVTTTLTPPSSSSARTITSIVTSLVTSSASTTSIKASSTTTSEQSSTEPDSSTSTSSDKPSLIRATSSTSQTQSQTGTTLSTILASFINPSSGETSNFPGPTSSQSESSSSVSHKATGNVGAIVGGLLGGMAAVILTILAFLCCRRRRREREASWMANQFVAPSRHSLSSTVAQASAQTRESNVSLIVSPHRTNTLSNLRSTLGSSIGQPHLGIGEQFEVSPQRVEPSPLNGANRGWREDFLEMGRTDIVTHFDNEKSSGSNTYSQSPAETDDVRTALLDRFPGHGETLAGSTSSADRNDVVLLSQIATLQAEVDRLQSFHRSAGDPSFLTSSGVSQGDEPPPGYYGE